MGAADPVCVGDAGGAGSASGGGGAGDDVGPLCAPGISRPGGAGPAGPGAKACAEYREAPVAAGALRALGGAAGSDVRRPFAPASGPGAGDPGAAGSRIPWRTTGAGAGGAMGAERPDRLLLRVRDRTGPAAPRCRAPSGPGSRKGLSVRRREPPDVRVRHRVTASTNPVSPPMGVSGVSAMWAAARPSPGAAMISAVTTRAPMAATPRVLPVHARTIMTVARTSRAAIQARTDQPRIRWSATGGAMRTARSTAAAPASLRAVGRRAAPARPPGALVVPGAPAVPGGAPAASVVPRGSVGRTA